MNIFQILQNILKEDETNEIINDLSVFTPTEFDNLYDKDCNFSIIPNPKNFLSLEDYIKYEKEIKLKENKYFPIETKMAKEFNNGILFEYTIKERRAKFFIIDSLHLLFHLKHPEGKIKKVLKLKIYINTIIYLIKTGINKLCKMYKNNEDLIGNYMFIIKKFYNGLIKFPVSIKLISKDEVKINKKVKIVKNNNINEDEEIKKYNYTFKVSVPTVLISNFQKFNLKNDQVVIIENKNYKIIKI